MARPLEAVVRPLDYDQSLGAVGQLIEFPRVFLDGDRLVLAAVDDEEGPMVFLDGPGDVQREELVVERLLEALAVDPIAGATIDDEALLPELPDLAVREVVACGRVEAADGAHENELADPAVGVRIEGCVDGARRSAHEDQALETKVLVKTIDRKSACRER